LGALGSSVTSVAVARFDLSLKENMPPDKDLQKRIQRIGEIVEQLEATADPNARAMAKELLESLMALHGAALEQILTITSQTGETGESLIRKFGGDQLVSSLLLLYGLHPCDMQTRVTAALEKSRGFLDSHSAKAELVSISEDGAVTLRLHRKPGGCLSTAATVKSTLQAAIQDAAPDATSILVQEADNGAPRSGFVSLAQLAGGQGMAALSVARTQRSGD
jgi:Fe-S cluster biogenesis protein NfuA